MLKKVFAQKKSESFGNKMKYYWMLFASSMQSAKWKLMCDIYHVGLSAAFDKQAVCWFQWGLALCTKTLIIAHWFDFKLKDHYYSIILPAYEIWQFSNHRRRQAKRKVWRVKISSSCAKKNFIDASHLSDPVMLLWRQTSWKELCDWKICDWN